PKILDQLRHDFISLIAQPLNHTCPVSLGTVLADLPFAFRALNLDFKANNSPDLRLDEIGGRIANRPGLGAAPFHLRGQRANLLPEPIGIMDNLGPAPDVNG